MKSNRQNLTDKEKEDYNRLAKALGIQTDELLLLDFYNENIFDAGGEVEKIKYVFSNENPSMVLRKVKGLNDQNTVILSAAVLNYDA